MVKRGNSNLFLGHACAERICWGYVFEAEYV